MKTTASRKPVAKAPPVKKPPATFQQFIDKWFLPVLFVAVGGVIFWGIFRSWSSH
jgi:hypothetical protein